MKREFRGKLEGRGPGGAWVFLPIPFDVHAVFGTRGRLPVGGTINGFAFRNSLMPEGDATHAMMVNKALQAGAGAGAGDTVRVVLARDEKERTVDVPPGLASALRRSKAAAATFAALNYSQRREYADWIASAKQDATKASRVAKAVEYLAAGRKALP
jgi:hypothetical protein